MRLTYIFHSGFALEAEKSILIFDYWMDPADVMESILQSEKPLYVFSSHFHEDHFTREIFEWRKRKAAIKRNQSQTCLSYAEREQARPKVKENVTYILSKDILRHRRASKEEADAWLAKGASWSDDLVSVKALGSTDSGVSWIVETEGKRILHAGDLNNWYARFLPEAVPGQTIYSEEFEEDIDPIAHEKQYLGELKDIRKVADGFDLVMFPIDGRIGNGYTLGGRQFIERFKVGMFVPMHFVVSGFDSSWRMKEFTDEKNIPFWEITREGETIEIQ